MVRFVRVLIQCTFVCGLRSRKRERDRGNRGMEEKTEEREGEGAKKEGKRGERERGKD